MPYPTASNTIEALFAAVLDMDDSERASWLDQHCSDAPTREEVLALCRADAAAEGVLDTPLEELAAPLLEGAAAAEHRLAGRRIGAYRVDALLGEGGMATVWRAERCDGSFAQTVAIKCLKHALVTPDLQRRFERERQILAQLEHPHIARLLDGGVSDDRVPYIVMELVDGEPLVGWCRNRCLPLAARLQVFIKVLGAVQYAHQQLIVHRDLKPGNILVGRDGEPRLLDFGIAAMLEQTATGVQATRGVAWTPEYAAPEQLSGLPIGTAVDVYALGVILCELLAGTRPPPAHQRTDSDGGSRVAPSRLVPDNPRLDQTQRRRRARALRGDLDAIVTKALRLEPAARYGSAAELAADLRRHLAREPVQARRGVFAYRGVRFVQRHVAALAATFLVVLVLAVAAAYAVQQARQTRQALAQSDAVRGFLVDLFENNAPAGALSGLPSTRELLDRGAERARSDFAGTPRLQADMLTTIGSIYRRLGLFDQARSLLVSAREVERADGEMDDDQIALETRRQLGLLDKDQGVLKPAEQALRAVLDARQRGGGDTHTLATAMQDLAQVESKLGRHRSAIALQREALSVLRGAAADALTIARARNDLGSSLIRDGQFEAAATEYRGALGPLRMALGPVHEDVAQAASNLAVALRHMGRYEEAESLLREAIDSDQRIYRGDHPQTAQHLNNLGTLLYFRGRPQEARSILTQAHAMNRALFGDTHPETATSASNLALALTTLDRYEEAARLQRKVLEVFRAIYGERHYSVAVAENNLARTLAETGATTEARKLAEASLRLKRELRGNNDKAAAPALSTLARIDERAHNYAAALRHYDEITSLDGISIAAADVSIVEHFADRGRIRCEAGAAQAGLADLDGALAQPALHADATPLRRAAALSARGDCLRALGRESEAREAWQQALALRETRLPPTFADSQRLQTALAAAAGER